MKILYFGFYDPNYSRNQVIIKGLKSNGATVEELRENRRGIFNWLRLLIDYLKKRNNYDCIIVGFPGQELMVTLKVVHFIFRKTRPVVFDVFTSHYGGYVLDRKSVKPGSLKAKYYWWLDRLSCLEANLVLLDTRAHIEFFVKEFRIPEGRFIRAWIGADPEVYYSVESKSQGIFTVVFFGTFIPLQGVLYIIRAAEILSNEKVRFVLIGKGQEKNKALALAKESNLKNIVFKGFMSSGDIINEVAQGDICLGILGDTIKTTQVIPNKVYEAAAMKKTIITADTPAIRELFDDNDLYLIERANPQALADAVIKLMNNSKLRKQLAESGFKKYKENATPNIIGQGILEAIKNVK